MFLIRQDIYRSDGKGRADAVEKTAIGEAMAKTAEDNFRIQVWDREEKELLETISRSPDFGQPDGVTGEIRRRPGF